MVRLQIISGQMAGTSAVARHFPFSLGRSPDCQLRVQDDGVWETHCEFILNRGQCFVVKSLSQALVVVNGEAVSERQLRNGDIIDLGAAKMRFWLSDTRQKDFRWREWLTWLAFVLVLAVEIWLIYNLNA